MQTASAETQTVVPADIYRNRENLFRLLNNNDQSADRALTFLLNNELGFRMILRTALEDCRLGTMRLSLIAPEFKGGRPSMSKIESWIDDASETSPAYRLRFVRNALMLELKKTMRPR